MLGLGAARAVLFSELHRVIASGGCVVDPAHLMQLVATETQYGGLTPFTRHGINRVDRDAIQRSSFEESIQTLAEASLMAERTSTMSADQCVAVGERIPGGTGTVGVISPAESQLHNLAVNNTSLSAIQRAALFNKGDRNEIKKETMDWNRRTDDEWSDLTMEPSGTDSEIVRSISLQRLESFTTDKSQEGNISGVDIYVSSSDVRYLDRPSTPDY